MFGQLDPSAPVEMLPKEVGVEGDLAELVTVNVLHGRYRFVAGLGWHEYVEGCWRELPKTSNVVHDVVREFLKQRVEDLRAEGQREQATLWKAALTRNHLAAIVSLCRDMNGVLADPSELDQGEDIVNVRNGVLDLRTGMLRRSQPGYLLTKQTGAAYDPGATSPTWDAVLEAVPEAARAWLQVRIGQALSGWYEDSLVLAVGGGQNGKSAFMSAIMRAFGSYAGLISHRVLLQGASGQHPTELMDLRGLRLALLEETPEEGTLDTHQLKTVIGTPYISARRMRQDAVTFKTSHTLFINTNHFPMVNTTDHGTWRRLTAVRFPTKFVSPAAADVLRPGEAWGDPDLKSRIERDDTLPAAALAWVVEGARRWYADRNSLHALPEVVRNNTDDWRAASDIGYQFAMEHLELAPHALVPSSYMAEKFNEFLASQGKKRWSNQLVATRLPKSVEAALGQEIVPGVVKLQTRHTQGITDPFDAARHTIEVGKTMRAWEGVQYKEAR